MVITWQCIVMKPHKQTLVRLTMSQRFGFIDCLESDCLWLSLFKVFYDTTPTTSHYLEIFILSGVIINTDAST